MPEVCACHSARVTFGGCGRAGTGRRFDGGSGGGGDDKVIGMAAENFSTLTELSLRWNRLGDEGAKALAPAIAANASLTHIDLENNGFGEEGKAAIREAVSGKTGFKLEI